MPSRRPNTDTKARKGSGKRRHYRGKMVTPAGTPRSHTHGGHSQANRGYECGQPVPYPTKLVPGQYRVAMPAGRLRYVKETPR